jgi:L-lysine exporter family protein LysE/ArgO
MPIASAFIAGLVLGLGIAAPFGPINVEIVRRHLGHGLAAGLLVGLGACSVDTAYILLISFGLITVQPSPPVQAALTIAGAIILVVLAGMIVRSAGRSAHRAVAANADARQRIRLWRHYVVGLAMTAASPMNLVFWFGVIASGGHRVANAWGYWPTVAGVMCGTVSWVFSLNLALLGGRRFLKPRLLLTINLASAAILVGFAVWRAWPVIAG